MTNVKQLIEQQANALRNKKESIKLAEHYEGMAKLLREQTDVPKLSFKALAREKKSHVERYADKMRDASNSKIENMLKSYGFALIPAQSTGGKSVYGATKSPGLQIHIAGRYFAVYQGGVVTVAKTELTNMEAYLKANPIPKQNSKTTNHGSI